MYAYIILHISILYISYSSIMSEAEAVSEAAYMTTPNPSEKGSSRQRKMCEHGRRFHDCRLCRPEINCPHRGIRKNQCSICTPSILCEHGNLKKLCRICNPENVIKHYERNARNREKKRITQQQQQQAKGESVESLLAEDGRNSAENTDDDYDAVFRGAFNADEADEFNAGDFNAGEAGEFNPGGHVEFDNLDFDNLDDADDATHAFPDNRGGRRKCKITKKRKKQIRKMFKNKTAHKKTKMAHKKKTYKKNKNKNNYIPRL